MIEESGEWPIKVTNKNFELQGTTMGNVAPDESKIDVALSNLFKCKKTKKIEATKKKQTNIIQKTLICR